MPRLPRLPANVPAPTSAAPPPNAKFLVEARVTGTGDFADVTYNIGVEQIQANDKIPPGRYACNASMMGLYLQQVLPRENLLKPVGAVCDDVLKDFETFFSPETKELYAEFKLAYRRGILVHGKPGTGKTCLFNYLSDEIVARGGYVLTGHWSLIQGVLNTGVIQGPKVIVFDEFETLRPDQDSGLLNFLDGVGSPGDSYILAATNYLKKLPARITKRPSRFARVLELGPPVAEVRRQYLTLKMPPRHLGALDRLVSASEGLTLDQTQELMISHLVFGQALPGPGKIITVDEDGVSDYSDYSDPGEDTEFDHLDDSESGADGFTEKERAINARDEREEADRVAQAVVEKMLAAQAQSTKVTVGSFPVALESKDVAPDDASPFESAALEADRANGQDG